MSNEKGASVEQDISFWLEREKKLKELFRNDIVNEKHFLNEKLRYFNAVQFKHKGNLAEGEKIIFNVLKGDIKELEKRLYPNPVARLFMRAERAIRNILEERKTMKEHGHMKPLPLTFNQKSFDNKQKTSMDGQKENLKSGVKLEMKQKEVQGQKLNTGPLKESVPSRNTISVGPLRNINANRGSKLKDETSPKKQLRHRLH